MLNIFIALGIALGLTTSHTATAKTTKPLKHPIDEQEGKVRGPYRESILKLIKHWPKGTLKQDPKNAAFVKLVAYSKEDTQLAIGFGQTMTINTPLAKVKEILEDFANYKKLFFTFEDVSLKDRDGNRAITEWVQSIPLPFVPDTTYTTYFYIDDRDPKHVLYRYQLKESDDLKYSDGVIFLDKIDEKTTAYNEFDFYDAHWGIAGAAPGKIWKNSSQDIYLSDIAIKYKAEHPDWDYKKIKDESEKNFEEYEDKQLEEVLDHKKKFVVD